MYQNIYEINITRLKNLLLIRKPDISTWFLFPIRDLALWLYFAGILLIFYTSLTPWFLWKVINLSQFIAFIPIVSAFLLSRTLSSPIFTRKDYIFPILAYIVYALISDLLEGKNINGLIGEVFHTTALLSLFALNKQDLFKLGNLLSLSMGILLIPSIAVFFLYLIGFPLPNHHIDMPTADYSYDNYYFFLLDDRSLLTIIPRFHSVFVEPAHLAMACVALLLTQVGQWKHWYNITMFVAIFISFSLAGYIFLVVLYFVSAWMKHKSIMGKLLGLAFVCSALVLFTVNYNDGENLVNKLILERLSIENDGKLAGDNRVTNNFDEAYDLFIKSDRIFIGMGADSMEQFGFGNSGYKVFLYVRGLISLFLLIVFYLSFAMTSHYKRGIIVMFVVSVISFIPQAISMKYYFLIPMYILTFREVVKTDSLLCQEEIKIDEKF